jgi:hypothetical protein
MFCQLIIRYAPLFSAVSAALSLALLAGILAFTATSLLTAITLPAWRLLATLLTATLIIFSIVCHFRFLRCFES